MFLAGFLESNFRALAGDFYMLWCKALQSQLDGLLIHRIEALVRCDN